MAKLISAIQYSYENAKGRTVKGIVLARDSQYPFKMFSQECIRLSRFLSRYGVESAQVLQAFIDGNPIPASDTIGYSEYQGRPLIQLKAEKGDKRPLQFGAGKARLLAELVKAHSLGALQATLEDVIGEAKASDTAPPRKGKGKPQGGQGGGKPKVEQDEVGREEVEVVAHEARATQESELSLDQEIARLEGLIVEMFQAIPKAQARLRELKASRVAV